MLWEQRNRTLGFLVFSLLTMIGTYNSVVINSQSELEGNNVKFVKRLDEVYGQVKAGRVVAASVSWQKLRPQQVAASRVDYKKPTVMPAVRKADSAASNNENATPEVAQAAIQEDLNLQLVEVINTSKWQNGLQPSQFSGSLEANNGVIEALTVSLPNGGFSVSFAEMSGNVFEYNHEGEIYSGMIYQVNEKSYMVSLTNGPYEGSRLKFNAVSSDFDGQQGMQTELADVTTPGSFGNEAEAPNTAQAAPMSDVEMQQQGIELNQQQAM